MTLFIAITGLFLLLEPEGSDQVEILFLNSGGYTATFEGTNVTFGEHELRVSVGTIDVGTSARAYPTWLPGEPLEMGLLNVDRSPTRFRNVSGLLTGAEFLPGCEPSLRPGCSGPLALATCRAGDRNLLSGRLTLAGGLIMPGEISDLGVDLKWNEDPLPECREDAVVSRGGLGRPRDEEIWALLPLDRTSKEEPFVTKTFNGIIYKIELDDDLAKLVLGNSILAVRAEENDICDSLQPGLAECAYVRIDNSAESSLAHGHDDISVRGVDLHFALNYEVLQPEPNCVKRIPIWTLREKAKGTDCESGLGSRCVPPCACTKEDKSECHC